MVWVGLCVRIIVRASFIERWCAISDFMDVQTVEIAVYAVVVRKTRHLNFNKYTWSRSGIEISHSFQEGIGRISGYIRTGR